MANLLQHCLADNNVFENGVLEHVELKVGDWLDLKFVRVLF